MLHLFFSTRLGVAALLVCFLAAADLACGRAPAAGADRRLPFPVKLLLVEDSAALTSGGLLADTLDKAREATFNMAGVRVNAQSTSAAAALSGAARARRMAVVAVVAPFSVAEGAHDVPDTWLCRTAEQTTGGTAAPASATRCLNLLDPAARRHALGLVGQVARIPNIDAVVVDLARVRMDYGEQSRLAFEQETGQRYGKSPADADAADGETASRWRAWWMTRVMLFARDACDAVRAAGPRWFGLWIRTELPGIGLDHGGMATGDLAACAAGAARVSGDANPPRPMADFLLLDAAPGWFPADGQPVPVADICRLAARCFGPVPAVGCVCLEGEEAAHVTEEALTAVYQESGGLALQCRSLPYPEDAWLDLARVLEAPRRQLE